MTRAELIEAMARAGARAILAKEGWSFSERDCAPGSVHFASCSAAMEAALSAIEQAGMVVVPTVPTAIMVAAAAPDVEPTPDDYHSAQGALAFLPPNDHPDIADVLAQIAADYRAMVHVGRLK